MEFGYAIQQMYEDTLYLFISILLMLYIGIIWLYIHFAVW